MIHPSELLRTNSVQERQFSAPTNIIDRNPLDCGLTNLPILTRYVNLEKFATAKSFLIALSIVGFLQGALLSYFRSTSKIWGEYYHISQDHTDWLIYTNEFFVGILALPVSYWGNRIHRISWIGGLTIYHSISSLVLTIPEAYRKDNSPVNNITVPLCFDQPTLSEGDINYISLGLVIIFQLFYSMAAVSFMTHGITYLDDNIANNHSPAYIAIALAVQELGKQLGIYSSGIPILFKTNGIFISAMWILIATMAFIAGTLISLFPRYLPSVIMKELSASIIDIASGYDRPLKKEIVDGFFKSLWRLLKNKILILNIICAAFLQSALINFEIFEKYFNQSRFSVSMKEESMTQLVVNLVKQPLVALSIVTSGMIIAKTKAKMKSLVVWNIVVTILVMLFFASTAFLKCEHDIKTEYERIHTRPYCSSMCSCSIKEYHPICINSKTFFSPCFAGCQNFAQNSKVFENCTCGGDKIWNNLRATEGSCNADTCYLFFTISQANRIISTAILASTIVTNLMINLRCIMSRDKALALGLEATILGIIPYLPVKAIYGAIAEYFCEYRFHDACTIYSEQFGLFLSINTIIFMFLSLLVSFVVLFIIKSSKNNEDEVDGEELQDVNLRTTNNLPEESTSLMHNMRSENDLKTNSTNSALTSKNSLWEMENVGDDHDSVDFNPEEESSERVNQRRNGESDL